MIELVRNRAGTALLFSWNNADSVRTGQEPLLAPFPASWYDREVGFYTISIRTITGNDIGQEETET